MLESYLPDISNFIIVLYIAEFIVALMIIFLERKNPSATVAWIMIIFIVPVGGIVLYFLLSQNISRQRIFRLMDFEEVMISEALDHQIREMQDSGYRFLDPAVAKWHPMIKLHQIYSKSFYSKHNVISIFTDGNAKMDSLIDDIKNAKESVNIMYFIVKNDDAGKRLIRALIDKAREGVQVRFLMDAMGSRHLYHTHMQDLQEAGGKYAFFFSPKLKFLNLKLNYRNHRKMVIIDDRIGYLGGFNIGNEYLGKAQKFGYWRDTHLRITGGCVQDILARFIMDWRAATGEQWAIPTAYFSAPSKEGRTGVQIVSCGPDSVKEEVKHGYLKMISAAQKNIYIQTPYFVPDASILESLKNAALSGVDVRIMIPNKPDHMFVYWATYSYIGILLDAGARVYIYDKGFMHAKTVCADGEVASVGSANFDIRSFKLNFEANAFIYDPEVVMKLEAIFEEDMSESRELTRQLYRKRGLVIKFKESISRLLSDLL